MSLLKTSILVQDRVEASWACPYKSHLGLPFEPVISDGSCQFPLNFTVSAQRQSGLYSFEAASVKALFSRRKNVFDGNRNFDDFILLAHLDLICFDSRVWV